MFRIDKKNNRITGLKERTFKDLGFKERQHLQEWIEREPTCLGEELLIIQKEFDGFSDTQERLDLLALDNKGGLVVIENKLDDSGKDVTWQALKYVSYCVSLNNDNICKIYQDFLAKTGQSGNASDKIAAFLGVEDLSEMVLNRGSSQRIMLIAANFRKEVTSTVLWLLNFKLNIQCFKITPWALENELFLNVEQIIPIKDTRELIIGFADQAQDEVLVSCAGSQRRELQYKFWGELFKKMENLETTLYDNISPRKGSWISAGSGMRGVSFGFVVSRKYGRVEIYIDRGEQSENETIFDKLYTQREELEKVFGKSLEWERLDNKRGCRIKTELDADLREPEDWPKMVDFMSDAMVRIEKAFRKPIEKINKEMRSRVL